ncbi:MAG: Glu-tRNA(Gln) amidotransferase subunit GatE [Candidatus Methanomethylophilaceae archaeon]|nr:Glu-tRNA(Gln) amidotransferase subunit GatE [Candidatus Methanomethylophilaceae archaeon]MBR7123834.1 Glu-tRNA(Gln) amidotransferase subunit GatE [Candidatus Methanomethylophilaceae archaeon]
MTEYKLTCGIEIHQQLDTKKLFCSCDSHLCEEGHGSTYRRLRPTTSEMGEIDRAALAQFQRNLGYRYQSCDGTSCLVELDEEPPHDTNAEALATTLTFSEMMKARVVDEIHFMRKIVVDGSNTSGFQRTALVAMNGSLDVNGRDISILSICLEEDACRKVETTDAEVTYRTDRLGIPLIEIATGPDMHDPEEVMEVALRIGTLLRATRRVKRGIGTIREDLNISVPGGARIEIKGVQELRLLPLFVENEMKRQNMLIRVKEILLERGTVPAAFEPVDVTEIFKTSASKVIKGALSDKGKVIAVRLPGFKGVMNGENGTLRLGAEMAQRARTKGVKGIFHSDELPNYGIEPEFVDQLRDFLGMNSEFDAFAICAAKEKKAKDALEMAVIRANEALVGVPEETRDPLPDGTSKYSRPLPGAARMYPETDVPPITITAERMQNVRDNLPELPEEMEKRLVSQYGINAQQAKQVVREDKIDMFEALASMEGMSSVAASTLLYTFSELEAADVDTSKLDQARMTELFGMLIEGAFAKEALPAILKEMAVSGAKPKDALSKLGLEAVDESEAVAIIAGIVAERADFVKSKGMGAVGPLMGPVMGALKGKLDGKRVSDILSQEIKKIL